MNNTTITTTTLCLTAGEVALAKYVEQHGCKPSTEGAKAFFIQSCLEDVTWGAMQDEKAHLEAELACDEITACSKEAWALHNKIQSIGVDWEQDCYMYSFKAYDVLDKLLA